MHSKGNRRFKSKHFQHDYRYKWIKNVIKAYFHANINVNLAEQNIIQINSAIRINADVRVKKFIYVKTKCNFENGKYLASIMDFNEKSITCKTQISIF